MEEQHRLGLADRELYEGGLLLVCCLIGVLDINSDDLVALYLEVLLVLIDDGLHLLQVIGVDDMQLGGAMRMNLLEFPDEPHGMQNSFCVERSVVHTGDVDCMWRRMPV